MGAIPAQDYHPGATVPILNMLISVMSHNAFITARQLPRQVVLVVEKYSRNQHVQNGRGAGLATNYYGRKSAPILNMLISVISNNACIP